jgi:flagellar biosynthesis/type III secretory pathway M-ring protein FliF/YscJ
LTEFAVQRFDLTTTTTPIPTPCPAELLVDSLQEQVDKQKQQLLEKDEWIQSLEISCIVLLVVLVLVVLAFIIKRFLAWRRKQCSYGTTDEEGRKALRNEENSSSGGSVPSVGEGQSLQP